MKRIKILKLVTLLIFTFMITVFVAYKSRLFDNYVKKNAEGPLRQVGLGANSQKTTYSSKRADESPEQTFQEIDTVSEETKLLNKANIKRNDEVILPSSKSLIIVDQKLKLPPYDSLIKLLK